MAQRTNVMQKVGKWTPNVEALNKGTKASKSEQGINRSKGAKATGGEMWKKPGKTGKGLASARSDESSGQSMPVKGGKYPGCDNAKTYGGVEQPIQYSNAGGPKRTKFIW